MMTIFPLSSFAIILWFAFLGGCAPSPTILHPDFGKSVTEFKQAQILNPGAQGSEEPVEGFAGVASDTTIKQYEKSFSKKKQSSQVRSLLLGVGGGQGGQ